MFSIIAHLKLCLGNVWLENHLNNSKGRYYGTPEWTHTLIKSSFNDTEHNSGDGPFPSFIEKVYYKIRLSLDRIREIKEEYFNP